MDFEEYQIKAHSFAVYPKKWEGMYAILGLCGESGEVAETTKKLYRGDYDITVFREKLQKELGDVLWYVAELATIHNFNLETIASQNIDKLVKRLAEDKIKGSGSDR